MRTCKMCGFEREETEFYKTKYQHSKNKIGVCRACLRYKKYNVTAKEKLCVGCHTVKHFLSFGILVVEEDRLNKICYSCEETKKVCHSCNKALPHHAFHISKGNVRKPNCKECEKAKEAGLPSALTCLHCNKTFSIVSVRIPDPLCPVCRTEHRICDTCNEVKPITDFHKHTKSIYRRECALCRVIKEKEEYHENIEESREKARLRVALYRASNLEETRTRQKLYQRKRVGRFSKVGNNNLTKEQWFMLLALANNKCLCCGKSFGESRRDRANMDHIDPEKGLSVDNTQPLCGSCNSSKRRKIVDYRPDWYKKAVASHQN